MQGTITMKRPKDLEEGDKFLVVNTRGMGSETEIVIHKVIDEIVRDDGDMFITTQSFNGRSNWQLRGEELYEYIAVLA